MKLSDGWSPDGLPKGRSQAVYYAIIDHDGRIHSMNAAMNVEFGPGSSR